MPPGSPSRRPGAGIYYSLLSGRLAAGVLVVRVAQDRTDAAALRAYETCGRRASDPELRAGLAFRTLAARFDDRAIDALLELAAVDGIVPLLRRTANFNWHRAAALALLKNPGFRKIVLSTLWTRRCGVRQIPTPGPGQGAWSTGGKRTALNCHASASRAGSRGW